MKFYIADCFAEAKYQGNQLAVLIPDRPVDDGEMLRIAIETGFSETAFIMSGRRNNGGYDVCRASYARDSVCHKGNPGKRTSVEGDTQSEGRTDTGGVYSGRQGNHDPEPARIRGGSAPGSGGGSRIAFGGRCPGGEDFPVQWVSTGLEAVITPLKSVEALERCRVNYDERQRFIDRHYACSLLYFAPSEDGSLRVRVFMEDPGFLEDPATGSANGDLACWLLRYGFFGDRRSLSYTVSQGSEMGRPSWLYVDAAYDPVSGLYSTHVGGRVFMVAEGEWR